MLLAAGTASGAFAVVMGADVFAWIHLLCYALFGHIPVLLLFSAARVRGVSKPLAISCGAAALGLWGVAWDAFLVEPARIEVSTVRLMSEKIARPVRIVLMADIQTDRFGEYERRVFRLAMDQKPDLLLFAGDYVQCEDASTRRRLYEEIHRNLKDAAMPTGVRIAAVGGNVDDPTWPAVFAGLDAAVAQDTIAVEWGDLCLTCLSLGDSRRTDAVVNNPEPSKYHVVLGHSPDFALGRVDADLLLAGHTHGGQVRLPLVGPVMTMCHLPRAWVAGRTRLPGGATLIVSRGIGLERGHAPRLRFLCRPELVVIDLVPAAAPHR